MAKRVMEHDKIEIIWNSVVKEMLGDKTVNGVLLEDTLTGEQRELAVEGIFVAIGHQPNTDLFKGQIETNDVGYIQLPGKSTVTSVEGVFAAGDVADSVYRQAVTAAGTGCMAAIDAERWLAEQED
jgi:thioredoxin reductase (NADPH)